jgi:hypothetical protein
MKNQYLHFLNMISPFLITAFCIILAITTSIVPAQIQINIPIIGPIVTLQGTLADPRLLLSLAGLISLATPALRNYENLYPTNLKFHLFFDADGIETVLHLFSKSEIAMLKIDEDWRTAKYYQIYLDSLTALARQFHLPQHIEFTESTHADGEVIMHVRRTHGWQRYKIEQMRGFMKYNFPDKRGVITIIPGYFELRETKANLISASLKDIYIGWTKVIQPRITHYVHRDLTHTFHVAEMEVIAITKLRFFPYLDCGRTLYCIADTFLPNRSKNQQKLIPVGYGIYDPI